MGQVTKTAQKTGVNEYATPAPVGKAHLAYIDGIRALAALYVMLGHAMLIACWGTRKPSHVASILTGWLSYGHFAVDAFIVLSGFCLMLPVVRYGGILRGGAGNFFSRRIRRIVPPYYCALLLSILLATTVLSHKTETLWDYCLPVTKMGILAHILLLQNFHNAMQINLPMWSVAVEWQIYLLFPLLVLCHRRLGNIKTTLFIIFCSYSAYFTTQNTGLTGLTAQYLALFGLGLLGAVIGYSSAPRWVLCRRRINWRIAAVILFVPITAICGIWGRNGTIKNVGIMDFLVGVWVLTLLIAVGQDSGMLQRLLECKPLVFIGTFSYSIYLMHLPLLQLFYEYGVRPLQLGSTLNLALVMFVGGLFSIAVSYLFHLTCERPFMNNRVK